jgi:hypothetical protein
MCYALFKTCQKALGPGVKVLIDDSVPEATREKMEKIVTVTIGERPDAATLVVSIVRMSPGRGWEVFINDVQDAPLVDSIQNALKKGGF